MWYFIAYLLGALTTIRRKHNHAEYVKGRTYKECKALPIPIPITNVLPPISDEERAEQEKKNTQYKWKWRLEKAGFVVLTVYAGFTIASWWQVKRSVDVAVKAQRPYIIEDGRRKFIILPETLHPQVNIAFKNIGKTPAKSTIGVHRLVPFRDLISSASREENTARFRAFVQHHFDEMNIEANIGIATSTYGRYDIAPDQASPWMTLELFSPMYDADVPKLRTGETILVWMGLIRYFDPSMEKIWYQTDFCSFYFGDNPEIWHQCGTHQIIK